MVADRGRNAERDATLEGMCYGSGCRVYRLSHVDDGLAGGGGFSFARVWARLGRARHGGVWHGKARQARQGRARRGAVWQGRAGMAGHGRAGWGLARRGAVRQGKAWLGMARQGTAGEAGMAGHGRVWHGGAGHG
jgi:hypothetical protein